MAMKKKKYGHGSPYDDEESYLQYFQDTSGGRKEKFKHDAAFISHCITYVNIFIDEHCLVLK